MTKATAKTKTNWLLYPLIAAAAITALVIGYATFSSAAPDVGEGVIVSHNQLANQTTAIAPVIYTASYVLEDGREVERWQYAIRNDDTCTSSVFSDGGRQIGDNIPLGVNKQNDTPVYVIYGTNQVSFKSSDLGGFHQKYVCFSALLTDGTWPKGGAQLYLPDTNGKAGGPSDIPVPDYPSTYLDIIQIATSQTDEKLVISLLTDTEELMDKVQAVEFAVTYAYLKGDNFHTCKTDITAMGNTWQSAGNPVNLADDSSTFISTYEINNDEVVVNPRVTASAEDHPGDYYGVPEGKELHKAICVKVSTSSDSGPNQPVSGGRFSSVMPLIQWRENKVFQLISLPGYPSETSPAVD